MDFAPGMLVEIQGLQQSAQPVDALQGQIQPLDLNGVKAQLIDYDRDSRKWVAGTFTGALVAVGESFIQPLSSDAMENLDFVMGPKSDPALVAQQMTECLSSKGWAAIKVFVSEADSASMLSAAARLEEEGQFSRLALEFEPGYLGRGGAAKTVHVDPSSSRAPSYVQESALRVMDNNFSAISGMLMPYSGDDLGFEVYSRTSLLLRKPILPDDEDKYPPADIDDADAEGYLHLMHRRQIVVLQFVGPSTGSLKLIPKRSRGEEVRMKAEPNTMVVIHCNQYDYSYDTEADSLVLQSFFLNAPATWEMGEVSGALDVLVGSHSGPNLPKAPQVTIRSQHTRYGGGADCRDAYWSMLKGGTDGVTEFPKSRFEYEAYYDPDAAQRGNYRSYTKHSTFGIDGVELFDNKFFEISVAEARNMDPAQRQVMEVSYTCLLGLGFEKKLLNRKSENVGHFVAIDKDDWQTECTPVLEAVGLNKGAASMCYMANRFSFALNLKGASMQIDTACSSSLICTHVSKLHLRSQQNDPMPGSIVNGLNLILSPTPFLGMCMQSMLSHLGRCLTYNASADGYGRGELCGAIGFKLQDYDDEATACLAGSHVNQDGRSASMTAPNGPAQERCIQAVLRELEIGSAEIDIFECHGTGTALGDPIEVGSFKKVMSSQKREAVLVMGAHKSNLSHGEGGAGLAGLNKCVMQVTHCEVISNNHLRQLNPHLDISGFPCQPVSEHCLTRDDAALCGVSGFGVGGTNGHCETWGRNIFTSRSVSKQDPYTTFQKKLRCAPPAEITMNGDDVDDWETNGCNPKATFGDEYLIHIDEDGVAEWEKVEPEVPDNYGDEFAIQGTFNNWSPDAPMTRHESIPGLWVQTITIGSTGEEEFNIIGDGNDQLQYTPSTTKCISKAAPIQGPHRVTKDQGLNWLVQGTAGDSYIVEFFQQDGAKSILWRKGSAEAVEGGASGEVAALSGSAEGAE